MCTLTCLCRRHLYLRPDGHPLLPPRCLRDAHPASTMRKASGRAVPQALCWSLGVLLEEPCPRTRPCCSGRRASVLSRLTSFPRTPVSPHPLLAHARTHGTAGHVPPSLPLTSHSRRAGSPGDAGLRLQAPAAMRGCGRRARTPPWTSGRSGGAGTPSACLPCGRQARGRQRPGVCLLLHMGLRTQDKPQDNEMRS